MQEECQLHLCRQQRECSPNTREETQQLRVHMAWIILVLAGLFEIGWAIGLKYTEGFTRLWPSVWTVLAMIISLGLLGIVLFGEPINAARLISVALIIAGIVCLRLAAA